MLFKEKFKEDCREFKRLISKGKKLLILEDNEEREKEGHKWLIETHFFLKKLFGKGSSEVMAFLICFNEYEISNLLGLYKGTAIFIERDIKKGIGVLEGLYDSFKKRKIKRKSQIVILVKNIYFEIKDWAQIVFNKRTDSIK